MNTEHIGLLPLSETLATPPHASTAAGLDLHPESIKRFEATLAAEPTSIAGPAYRAAYRALEQAHGSVAAMVEAAGTLNAPPRYMGKDGNIVQNTQTPEDKAKVTSAMSASFMRGADTLGRAEAEIGAALKALTDRIDGSLQNPRRNEVSVAQTASQIRDYVRALPSQERMSFLMAAGDAGDREILQAIISGGAFVSGLDRTQFALAREFASKALAPAETTQREALLSLRENVQRAGANYLQRYERLLPRADAKSVQKNAALKKLEKA